MAKLNRLTRLELCKAILKCDTDEVKRILANPQFATYKKFKDSNKTKTQKAFMTIQVQQLVNRLLKDEKANRENK